MLDPGFTTAEMATVFSASSRVGALLQFEAALALALADVGLAPSEAADAVAEACRTPIVDPKAVLAATWTEGSPLIPLTREIRSRLSEADAEWVHHGATTQDAIDTATMLQARQALDILDNGLTAVARLAASMVIEFRGQPQIGRTFLQHARPTTFGMRAASWLDPTVRHISALRRARAELVVQLGGPVGNLAPYDDRGVEMMGALAARLGLGTPILPWHTDRSRLSELASTVERAARTMAKIAVDLALLAQSDIAEIRVRAGGSSSMGGKRNPIDAVRAIAAAEACSAAAGMVTAGRPHELDRAIGGWHVEWLAIPLLFQTAGAAVEAINTGLETLEVDGDRMTSHVGPDAEALNLDGRLIDRVLSDFEDVVGTG